MPLFIKQKLPDACVKVLRELQGINTLNREKEEKILYPHIQPQYMSPALSYPVKLLAPFQMLGLMGVKEYHRGDRWDIPENERWEIPRLLGKKKRLERIDAFYAKCNTPSEYRRVARKRLRLILDVCMEVERRRYNQRHNNNNTQSRSDCGSSEASSRSTGTRTQIPSSIRLFLTASSFQRKSSRPGHEQAFKSRLYLWGRIQILESYVHYILWYHNPQTKEIGIHAVILQTALPYGETLENECVASMAAIHIALKRAGAKNATIWGIYTNSYDFSLI